MISYLDTRVEEFLKFFEDQATDIVHLMGTPPEIVQPESINSLLGLKMAGLSMISRTMNLVSDFKTKEVINVFQVIELSKHDRA